MCCSKSSALRRFKSKPVPEFLAKDHQARSITMISARQRGTARANIDKFNNAAKTNEDSLTRNPFSETYKTQHFDKKAADYGRPPKGSKTEARGIKAGVHIMKEVLYLMEVINDYAQGEHPNRFIKFGTLFSLYENYSNTLVGIMLRARKHKLIDFEGEMLYQRQDEEKPILMLKTIQEIRQIVRPTRDPASCIPDEKTDTQ